MQHSGHQQPHDRGPDADYERERAPFFTSPVQPPLPHAGTSGPDFFRMLAHGSGPLSNLAGVYLGWEQMLNREKQAVWLTIAGAYIPFGLGGTMRALIEHHFVDFIVTTPAQITHDLTEVRGLHHYHGTPHVDDNMLQRLDVNRYWNTYGDENELNSNEDVIAEFAATLSDERAYTPSEYFYPSRSLAAADPARSGRRHDHLRRTRRHPDLLSQPCRRRHHHRPCALPKADGAEADAGPG